MALILKNTFLDIEEPGEKVHTKRSSSAPPAWKPLNSNTDGCTWESGLAIRSDESTAASDDESFMTPGSQSDADVHDADRFSPHEESNSEGGESIAIDMQTPTGSKATLCSDSTTTGESAHRAHMNTEYMWQIDSWAEESESVDSDTPPPSSGKWTLSLEDMVVSGPADASDVYTNAEFLAESSASAASDKQPPLNNKFKLCLDDTVTSSIISPGEGPKTKLSSKARAFAPVKAVDGEIRGLIESMQEVLHASPEVLSVKVSEGIMGGTTTVLAEIRSSGLAAAAMMQTLCLLKATLLNAASESECAYVLGYGAQPFEDTGFGFTATVGCVSPLQEHSVCWDTYELGFCPRRNMCRWCHPAPADLMQISVMLKESA